MSYEEKLAIANAYLEKHAGLGWNDFSDINSLHDANTEEEVFSMCNDRLREDGYPMDLIEEEDQDTEIEPTDVEPEEVEDVEIVEEDDDEDDSCVAFYED